MSLPGSDVRQLMDIGVRPTIGQASGGVLNRFEQALGNTFPFLGDMVKASRRRSVLDFNRGVINDTLEPIGETLPASTATGRPALNYAIDATQDAYNKAVPQAGAQLDQQALSELRRCKTD